MFWRKLSCAWTKSISFHSSVGFLNDFRTVYITITLANTYSVFSPTGPLIISGWSLSRRLFFNSNSHFSLSFCQSSPGLLQHFFHVLFKPGPVCSLTPSCWEHPHWYYIPTIGPLQNSTHSYVPHKRLYWKHNHSLFPVRLLLPGLSFLYLPFSQASCNST